MSAGQRAVGVILAPALLVAVVALQHSMPGTNRQFRTFEVTGGIGETVQDDALRLTVEKVEVARGLVGEKPFAGTPDPPAVTSGVWVVVWAEATARREPVVLDRAELQTREGHRYVATDPGFSASGLDNAVLGPEITRYGPLIFELPESRLAGVDLVIGRRAPVLDLNSQLRVNLGIDEGRAGALLAEATDAYVLEKAVYR